MQISYILENVHHPTIDDKVQVKLASWHENIDLSDI